MDKFDHTLEEGLNLKELIDALLKFKYFITVITLIFAFASVKYSISLPNIYTSKAVLQFSDDGGSSQFSNIASQYGGVASLAGLSIPSQSSSKNHLAIATIQSREFVDHLIGFEGISANLMAAKEFNPSTKKIIYDPEIYDSNKNQWIRSNPPSRKKIPSNHEIYETIYNKTINLTLERDSGFLIITFEHLSPVFAKEFLDLLIQELNNVVREKDLNEATLALKYLENQLDVTIQKDVRQSINKLIEAQLKTKMFANTKDDYLVSSIDKPYIPEVKSSPRRLIICIIGTMIGFFLSCFLVLIRHYFLVRN